MRRSKFESELGELVASEMSNIMDSDEFRSLHYKIAKKKEDKKDKKDEKDDKDDKDKKPFFPFFKKKKDKDDKDDKKDKKEDKDDKKDKKDKKDDKKDKKEDKDDKKDKKDKKDDKKDKKKDKKKASAELITGLVGQALDLSIKLEKAGLIKSAVAALKTADYLMVEAAGADFAENVAEDALRAGEDIISTTVEGPGGVEITVEEPGEPTDPFVGFEGADVLPIDLSFEDEGAGARDLDAQIEAIEAAGLGGKEPSFEDITRDVGIEDMSPSQRELVEKYLPSEEEVVSGLEDIEKATAEVERWITKNSGDLDEMSLDVDLRELLSSSEDNIEDYLIKHNLKK